MFRFIILVLGFSCFFGSLFSESAHTTGQASHTIGQAPHTIGQAPHTIGQEKVHRAYNKVVRSLKDFTKEVPIADVHEDFNFQSFDLEPNQLILFKEILDQELDKLNNDLATKNPKQLSAKNSSDSHLKNQAFKVFRSLQPKNSFERTRNKLVLMRFSISGVFTGFSVYLVNPEAPYMLTAALNGMLGAVMQYNSLLLLDFAEQPLRIARQVGGGIHHKFKIFLDSSFRSSEWGFFKKSFVISILYFFVAEGLLSLIDKGQFLSLEQSVDIAVTSVVASIFIGSLERINGKMRLNSKKALLKKMIKSVSENKEGIINTVFDEMRGDIQSRHKLTDSEFANLKEHFKGQSDTAERILSHELFADEIKEEFIKKIVDHQIETTPEYLNHYNILKTRAALRSILTTSLTLSLGLATLAQDAEPLFLGRNALDFFMLIGGVSTLIAYNSYQKFKDIKSLLPENSLPKKKTSHFKKVKGVISATPRFEKVKGVISGIPDTCKKVFQPLKFQ